MSWRCSSARLHSASLNFDGFAPVSRSMNDIVSGISDSNVIRPLRSCRLTSSSKVRTSLVTFALYAMPVNPLCQGALWSRLGSQLGALSCFRSCLSTFGIFAWSSFWIQPRPIIRAAIQSVSTKMSRPVD